MLTSANGYNRLRPRQQRALVALLVGRSAKAAAADAGVSYASLRRWMAQPEFQAALQQAERAILQDLQARLTALGLEAVVALADSLAPDEDPRTRLKAAGMALAYLIRLKEVNDLERRIAALEEAVEVHRGAP